MNFNKHSDLEGTHAFLGASRSYWLNYDIPKLRSMYEAYRATERGTEYHNFAAQCIRLGQKLPRSKKTLNHYVNDCIGFRMTPEQILYYSRFCYGTADAISFRNNVLRISDYKSGSTPAKMEQILIYMALFCLEYHIDPSTIKMEGRLYQSDEVQYHEPAADEIFAIMKKIIEFDRELTSLTMEE